MLVLPVCVPRPHAAGGEKRESTGRGTPQGSCAEARFHLSLHDRSWTGRKEPVHTNRGSAAEGLRQ